MPHYLSVFIRRPAKNNPFLQGQPKRGGDQVSSVLNDIYNLVYNMYIFEYIILVLVLVILL